MKLDFGSSNIVGVPRELCLVASNTSAVTTQLTVSVELFTAAQTGSSNDDTLGIRSARRYINNVMTIYTLIISILSGSLLRSTRNIADPTAKTDKQNKSGKSLSLYTVYMFNVVNLSLCSHQICISYC